MSSRVNRFSSVVRTAVRRRGVGYASHLWTEHVVPRVAYSALLGPSIATGAAARLAETLFTAADLVGVDAVLARARTLHEQHRPMEVSGVAAGTRGRTDDFAHEWLAIELLRDTGLVPRVLSVDERSRSLVLSDSHGDGEGLEGEPGRADVVHAAAAAGHAVEEALNIIHRFGIVGVRYALDHARLAGGRVRFAALPGVRVLRRWRTRFQVERDWDRMASNDKFGLELLTEARVRTLLRDVWKKLPPGWFQDYAPIDFGGGVSVGRFAKTDSGTGRWDVFNRDLVGPLVRGARVLDLGSNNGSLPLMMLRSGASEVVAVERSPLLAEAARVNAQVLEWRDMRPYRLRVHVGDMRDVLQQDWGTFDVVTAFCSLYYLPEPDMAAIIRHAASMRATLVLQSNDGAENIPASRARRLKELMQQGGYGDVRLHAFGDFARSILIGVPEAAIEPIFA